MNRNTKIAWALGALIVILFGVLGYLYYQTADALSTARIELGAATSTTAELETKLQVALEDNKNLNEAFQAEKERNDAFEERVNEIGGTIDKLDKLSRMDPELLQKYSKVYFLNENYLPSSLTSIPETYRFQEEKEEEIHTQVWPHLENLLEEAKEDGIDLLVASSYRSFGRQGQLKASYTVRYGSGANAFSAEQGYSEHQLGTTIDLTTQEVGGSFVGFDQTEAFEWLTENAYKYGFVLSYPKGNTFYQYEPWHWRFVGRDLARDLHNDDQYFYSVDQREIDTYLIDFFD
jgi:LAS superfamily LD-carboxypeptidase LdcB